jgi:hypothetical protein
LPQALTAERTGRPLNHILSDVLREDIAESFRLTGNRETLESSRHSVELRMPRFATEQFHLGCEKVERAAAVRAKTPNDRDAHNLFGDRHYDCAWSLAAGELLL